MLFRLPAAGNVLAVICDRRTGSRLAQIDADQLAPRPDGRVGPDMRVARRAAEEWGVLSLDELRACGLSKQAVVVRAGNGRLHRLHRGVYAVGHANPPLEGRFLAAVKACGPDAALSHYSAGALWRFVEWDYRYLEVTVAGETTRVRQGIRVHKTQGHET